MLEDALTLYVEILEDEETSIPKSKFELWMELCEFVAKHPSRAQHLPQDPDQLIRHAIRKYTDESGRLWLFLADYFTRLGLFGKARDIFEEALA